MTYAISDVHGNYDALKLLVDRIGLGEGDLLYLLGDYVDGGDKPIETLEFVWDLAESGGARALCGNHDELAYGALDSVENGVERYFPNGNSYKDVWFNSKNGGFETYKAYKSLSPDCQKKVFGILRSLSANSGEEYWEVGGNKVCVCHAAPYAASIDTSKEGKRFCSLWSRPSIVGLKDCMHSFDSEEWRSLGVDLVVHGHTTVTHMSNYIDAWSAEDGEPTYYEQDGQGCLNIDCGARHIDEETSGLTCVCLDNMQFIKVRWAFSAKRGGSYNLVVDDCKDIRMRGSFRG